MSFGQRLKHLRKQRSWTQEETADRLEVTRDRLAKYETDVNQVDNELLVKIARIFNVSVDYLLGCENDQAEIGLLISNSEFYLFLKDYMSAPVKQREILQKIWWVLREDTMS